MSDLILKQNAGRGGAVVVTGVAASIPTGEYSHVDFVASTVFSTLPSTAETPLLTLTQLLTTTAFAAGTSLKTPFIINGTSTGKITGTAIFYKAITV